MIDNIMLTIFRDEDRVESDGVPVQRRGGPRGRGGGGGGGQDHHGQDQEEEEREEQKKEQVRNLWI